MLYSAVISLMFQRLGKRRKVSTVCHVSKIAYFMQVQDQGDQKMVSPGSPGANGGSVSNIEAGNISNENAERRANTPANQQDFTSIQAFDGVGECL